MPPADEPRRARTRLGLGAGIVLVLAALVVTVGIGIVRGAAAPSEVVSTSDGFDVDAAPDVSGSLYVDVAGAVATPGLYILARDARVVDAIAAAGGFLPDADEQAVNLARPLSDGEQLVVPLLGAGPAATAGSPAGDGKVNLNTADVAALDTLPRIGPALAARIIDWREANGRFTSVEDLLAVSGFGDRMLETLRPLVTV